MIVSVAKYGSGDRNAIAQRSLGGIAATTYSWLHLFNNDALAALDRFHSTQFQKTLWTFVFRFNKLLLYASYRLWANRFLLREMRIGPCSLLLHRKPAKQR
jgi:hypothetical protein